MTWLNDLSIATGKLITSISEATEKDVDLAVASAQKAFDTVWGLNTPGSKRAEALWSLAQAMERHKEELAAIEALDNGELLSFFCFKSIDLVYTFSQEKHIIGPLELTCHLLSMSSSTLPGGQTRSPVRPSRYDFYGLSIATEMKHPGRPMNASFPTLVMNPLVLWAKSFLVRFPLNFFVTIIHLILRELPS